MKRLFSFLILILIYVQSYSQASLEHISNKKVYDFLDELANEKVISLYSVAKPYSRALINNKLNEASKSLDKLNTRQQKELEHYIDYYSFGSEKQFLPQKASVNIFPKSVHTETSIQHLGLFYSDSTFVFALRPIIGINLYSNESGVFKHTYGGLEAFSQAGNHLSVYANLRDNQLTEALVKPEYFSQDLGGNYKGSTQGNTEVDYSEMRGGILFHWRTGEVGLIKDHIEWGNNYYSSIIYSGRTPSFPMISFHLNPVKWFDFKYYHGWLVSEVLDSAQSYLLSNGNYRGVYRNKYIAANMFSFMPVPGLSLSFGNSIIYSDVNINPAYLIPVLFYKSVDHTVNSNTENQNSQMFFDISSRLIKHTHLYANIYVDDFSITRVSDPSVHNFYAYKIGGKLSNWPVRNTYFLLEYTKTVPVVYKHYVESLTFESNKYRMGYYMGDNSQEIYFKFGIKLSHKIHTEYTYINAEHGNEYPYIDGYIDVTYPILEDITWSNESHNFGVYYEFFTNSYLSIEIQKSNIKGYDVDGMSASDYLFLYGPEYYHGNKLTYKFKMNIGF